MSRLKTAANSWAGAGLLKIGAPLATGRAVSNVGAVSGGAKSAGFEFILTSLN